MTARLKLAAAACAAALLLTTCADAQERAPAPELTLYESGLTVDWQAIDGAVDYEVKAWTHPAERELQLRTRSTSIDVMLGELGDDARKVRAKVRAFNERGRHGYWSATSDWLVIQAKPPRARAAKSAVAPTPPDVSIKLVKSGLPRARWVPIDGIREHAVRWYVRWQMYNFLTGEADGDYLNSNSIRPPSERVNNRHKHVLDLSASAAASCARGTEAKARAQVYSKWGTTWLHSTTEWIAFTC